MDRDGLRQVSDASALEAVIDRVIAENPGPVEQFRSGKEGALNALIGPVMKATNEVGERAGRPRAAAEAPLGPLIRILGENSDIRTMRNRVRADTVEDTMYVVANHVA